MKQELKPCHCGAEANLMYDDSTQVEMCYVECSKCLMATMQDTYENVINAWNTRPDHSGESIEISESQMRYEIAKEFTTKSLAIILNNPKANLSQPEVAMVIRAVCKGGINIANELINQLKKQNDEK